jgi:hypothetical protein
MSASPFRCNLICTFVCIVHPIQPMPREVLK